MFAVLYALLENRLFFGFFFFLRSAVIYVSSSSGFCSKVLNHPFHLRWFNKETLAASALFSSALWSFAPLIFFPIL